MFSCHSPPADSRRAVVIFYGKYEYLLTQSKLALVKYVVRLTAHLNMTIPVDWDIKTTHKACPEAFHVVTGLQIRVRIGKLFSLFLIQNICCGYSKEPSQ